MGKVRVIKKIDKRAFKYLVGLMIKHLDSGSIRITSGICKLIYDLVGLGYVDFNLDNSNYINYYFEFRDILREHLPLKGRYSINESYYKDSGYFWVIGESNKRIAFLKYLYKKL